MLVAHENRRSRATVLYGILAKSALDQLESQDGQRPDRSAYFQNLVRLLDHYRLNTLQRPSPKGVLDRRPSDSRDIRQEKMEAEAVQAALAGAHQAIYPEMTKEEVVQHLKVVFSMIGRHQVAEIAPNDLHRAKAFLTSLAAALRTT